MQLSCGIASLAPTLATDASLGGLGGFNRRNREFFSVAVRVGTHISEAEFLAALLAVDMWGGSADYLIRMEQDNTAVLASLIKKRPKGERLAPYCRILAQLETIRNCFCYAVRVCSADMVADPLSRPQEPDMMRKFEAKVGRYGLRRVEPPLDRILKLVAAARTVRSQFQLPRRAA